MSAIADAYSQRCEAERLVGEDRVPVEELERLCSEYGDTGSGGPSPRAPWLRHRAAMILAIVVRRLAHRPCAKTPAARRLDGVGAIEALFNAVLCDSELTTLDELVERAGLGWRCQAEVVGFPCDYLNVASATCWACGADEALGKEEGDG